VPALSTATSRRPNRATVLVDQILHLVLVANVGTDEFNFCTGGAKLGGQGLAGVIATPGNDDMGAFLRESESGGAANAGQGAGDQGAGDQDDGVAHTTSP
jgi:hypothetical protein